MIIIEVDAIQRAQKLELRIDERILAGEMAEGIRRILGDETAGFLWGIESRGILTPDLSIDDHNINNGERLLYISKTA